MALRQYGTTKGDSVDILAVDLGTKLGWAHAKGKKIKSGTVHFKTEHFDGAGMVFLKFERWLQQFKSVDLLAVEGVMSHGVGQTYQQHRYGGLLAIIQKFGDTHEIPYTGEGVTTIKKFWTGSGGASKAAMVESARSRGFNPCDDNEADALALLHLVQDLYDFK